MQLILANVDVFVRRVLRVRKFKRTRIISRWASRTQTTWTTWKPRSWQKYLMANQRTVKFLRSLSLKWFLPTFPFPGEITFVDSKYDPISGESYGIPKKCTTLWQYQSWKGIFLLPNEVLPLTEWPQGHLRNKLDSVGNNPPPSIYFCLKLSIESISGSVVPSAMFRCVKWLPWFQVSTLIFLGCST